MGAGIVVSGLVGAGIVGALVDKTRKYKLFLLICFACTAASLLMFAFFLEPDEFCLLTIASCLLGFFMTPVLPVSLELSCEISYPIGEATPTGLLMIGGQVFGIGYVLLCN
jgi:FLVCR family feline leukemia virus subgroup C receptor-related protein